MIAFFAALLLLAVALLFVTLLKTYDVVSSTELKRQAQSGDELAKVLYKAVAYQGSLQVFLWGVIIAAVAGSFVLLSQVAPLALVFVLEVLIMGLAFVWIPRSSVGRVDLHLAIWSTPLLVGVVSRLYRVLRPIASGIKRHRPVVQHSHIYDRDDLLALLQNQKQQPDNRVDEAELQLVERALHFRHKTATDILTPRSKVCAVSEDDTIGPILMKELHDSGFTVFPVYAGAQKKIVGTLFLKDVVKAKEGGPIKSIMRPHAYFIHEEAPLSDIVHAFQKTKNHLYIVVNRFEEYVGIATIEDVLSQVLYQLAEDDFDRYDDMQAVLARQQKRRTAPAEKEPTPEVDAEVSESKEDAVQPSPSETVENTV